MVSNTSVASNTGSPFVKMDDDFIMISDLRCINQRIGLRENLQQTIDLLIELQYNKVFLILFPIQPIH